MDFCLLGVEFISAFLARYVLHWIVASVRKSPKDITGPRRVLRRFLCVARKTVLVTPVDGVRMSGGGSVPNQRFCEAIRLHRINEGKKIFVK